MKGKVIKELESMGIRYAEKEKEGLVKINHLRFPQLVKLLAEEKAKREI